MEDLTRLLTVGLAIVSIATLAGLGLLRGVVTGLRERLKDASEEITEQDRRLTAAKSEVAQLRTDLAALGRVVTGEAHWVSIGDKLDVHHTEAQGHWLRDEQILQEIRDRLPSSNPRKQPGGTL